MHSSPTTVRTRCPPAAVARSVRRLPETAVDHGLRTLRGFLSRSVVSRQRQMITRPRMNAKWLRAFLIEKKSPKAWREMGPVRQCAAAARGLYFYSC